VIYLGVNGKMSEISAAMGLTGLESLDVFIAANRCNYAAYRAGLRNLPGIQLIAFDEAGATTTSTSSSRSNAKAAGIGRDELVRILHAENVLARRYFYPAAIRWSRTGLCSPPRACRCPRPRSSPVACCRCPPARRSAGRGRGDLPDHPLRAAHGPEIAARLSAASGRERPERPAMPKLSVAMITYNHERFVAQAIESVLIQETDFDFELVIGEDCSTDRTREIVVDWHARIPAGSARCCGSRTSA